MDTKKKKNSTLYIFLNLFFTFMYFFLETHFMIYFPQKYDMVGNTNIILLYTFFTFLYNSIILDVHNHSILQ